jgi:hypothetical protein
MISLEVKDARVFVRPGATDMRKQAPRAALHGRPTCNSARC